MHQSNGFSPGRREGERARRDDSGRGVSIDRRRDEELSRAEHGMDQGEGGLRKKDDVGSECLPAMQKDEHGHEWAGGAKGVANLTEGGEASPARPGGNKTHIHQSDMPHGTR